RRRRRGLSARESRFRSCGFFLQAGQLLYEGGSRQGASGGLPQRLPPVERPAAAVDLLPQELPHLRARDEARPCVRAAAEHAMEQVVLELRSHHLAELIVV